MYCEVSYADVSALNKTYNFLSESIDKLQHGQLNLSSGFIAAIRFLTKEKMKLQPSVIKITRTIQLVSKKKNTGMPKYNKRK